MQAFFFIITRERENCSYMTSVHIVYNMVSVGVDATYIVIY